MPTRNILVSTSSFAKIDCSPLKLLEDAGFKVELNPYKRKLSPEESRNLLIEKQGLIAGTELIDEDLLNRNPQLECIVRMGVGLDNVDVEAANNLGVPVFYVEEAHVQGVAQLSIAGILSLCHKLQLADISVRSGTWEKPAGMLLYNKTVGIVGLGKVGRELVRLLKPFNVEFVATELNPEVDFIKKHGINLVTLTELTQRSDIICINVPLNSSTKGLMGTHEFEKMKKRVIISNCSRGGIVDEFELCSFLEMNKSASAHVDTFQEEPYPGPLQNLPNILLSPHIGSYPKEVRVAMELEATNKMIQFFDHK